jgi:hypothetical protein
MQKIKLIVFFICACVLCNAQNVGIGTTTPGFPLNFASTTGDKISLYGDNGSHYGFGIQGGLLQIHSDAPAANIAFGYGSSGAFTERAKIINQGEFGMTLRGRLQLQTGTNSAGHWLTNMANTINVAFIGMASDNQVGFYGGTGAQWGLTMNTTNGNVGIGNIAPNVPLAFAPSLGKKITLYPGVTGDVGFGVAGNRLQIYSDNPNADVAIGYDAAGVFNERFAFKPNGAMAVNGNTGASRQLLTSNGNAAVAWANILQVMPVIYKEGSTPSYSTNNNTAAFPPETNMDFNVAVDTKVLVFADIKIYNNCGIGQCFPAWDFEILVDNVINSTSAIHPVTSATRYTDTRSVGPVMINLAPGNHTISFRGFVSVVGSVGGLASMSMKATAIELQ